MKNPFMECKQLVRAAVPIVADYVDQLVVDNLVDEINQKIEDKNLQIMFFGAYNSGKSTIINALLGQELAAVEDIPTTDKIDYYDWNGYVLIDSPGVNAPIDHEKVAQTHLERSDLIVFVIRQDDQDAKDVYERMFDLLQAKKKIFIILNHQTSTPADLIKSVEKINEILIRYAQERSMADDVIKDIAMIPMNGRTALKGRLESKHKLLEHSGYDGFEAAFQSWLRMYDNECHHLASVQHQIENTLLIPAIESIDAKIGNSPISDRSVLYDSLKMVGNQKQILLQACRSKIRQEILQIQPELFEALLTSTSGEYFETSVQKSASQVSQKIQVWLQQELDDMRTALVQSTLNVLGVEEKGIISRDENGNQIVDTVAAKAVAQLKNLNADNIAKLLKLGRKLKIPFLKGRWTKTFEKWAGKAAPVIMIVTSLIEIGLAQRSQNKQNQAQRQQALQRRQIIDQISDSMAVALLDAAESVIREIMDEQMDAIKKEIERINRGSDKMQKDRQSLIYIKEDLNAVRFS